MIWFNGLQLQKQEPCVCSQTCHTPSPPVTTKVRGIAVSVTRQSLATAQLDYNPIPALAHAQMLLYPLQHNNIQPLLLFRLLIRDLQFNHWSPIPLPWHTQHLMPVEQMPMLHVRVKDRKPQRRLHQITAIYVVNHLVTFTTEPCH